MTMTQPDDSANRSDLLAIYLRDHHAGSAAGLRLAMRARDTADGVAHTMLVGLVEEIADDQQQLESLMKVLNVQRSRLKNALAVVAERAARLKLNGRLLSRSPLSGIVELEALGSGVRAKRDLWSTLLIAAAHDRRIDRAVVKELHERASAQLASIDELHDAAVQTTFT